MNTANLQEKAQKLRTDIIKSIYWAQSGHPWGSLSAIDLMTVLYFWGFLKYNAQDPKWEWRDYFIMSKGHWSPAYYSILADLWYFSGDELFSFRQIDSLLQWHPTNKVPWVEVSTGSLGQWLSVAVWIALGLKSSWEDNKVWALCWDWELQEWQIWEAAMSASHYNLWNLVVIVDRNWLQIDWATSDVMDVGNISKKFSWFDWEVLEVDWHNMEEIASIYTKAIEIKDKPVCIVADTSKWKWVSFMEDNYKWHWKAPNEEEYNTAIGELSN